MSEMPMCVCGHDAKAHLDFVQTANCLDCDCERFTRAPAATPAPSPAGMGEPMRETPADEFRRRVMEHVDGFARGYGIELPALRRDAALGAALREALATVKAPSLLAIQGGSFVCAIVDSGTLDGVREHFATRALAAALRQAPPPAADPEPSEETRHV